MHVSSPVILEKDPTDLPLLDFLPLEGGINPYLKKIKFLLDSIQLDKFLPAKILQIFQQNYIVIKLSQDFIKRKLQQ
jgi:hypothetical protein